MNSYIRRRIWWEEDRARIDFGTTSQSEITLIRWVRVPPFSKKGQIGTNQQSFQVLWEDMLVEEFAKLSRVLEWITRCAYNIKDEYLVPSELLFDAGLSYLEHSLWVDSFNTPALPNSLDQIVCSRVDGVTVPRDRGIRLVRDLNNPFTEHLKDTKPVPTSAPKKSTTTSSSYSYTGHYYWEPPARPADGSNFSVIAADWEDYSWEARTYRSDEQPDLGEEFDNIIVLKAE